MKNRNNSVFLMCFGLALLALVLSFASACGDSDSRILKERADLLILDGMKIHGELERAPVQFKHDNHTLRLEAEGQGCSVCHLANENGTRSIRFMRIGDVSGKQQMEIYHNYCIGCHQQRLDLDKDSGPVTCGDCHKNDPEYIAAQAKIGFSKTIHYNHIKAMNYNCVTCHHETLDQNTGKPRCDKADAEAIANNCQPSGYETSCRDCHMEKAIENRSSIRDASHAMCIDCHQKRGEDSLKTGPVICSDCHDRNKQILFKKPGKVPRLKRYQPDKVIIGSGNVTDELNRLAKVEFNHLAHENAVENCHNCHHGQMNKCNSCHTTKGDIKGGRITLEQSMHAMNEKGSCVGCHNVKKKEKDCAGCHDLMPKHEMPKSSCTSCHNHHENEVLANNKVHDNDTATQTEDSLFKNIPEQIDISQLEAKFDAARFPHKKIILALKSGADKSKLATHFHGDDETLCMGCHHHSPKGTSPPACISCHNKPFDEKDLNRPGLLGAYHQQCIGCHKSIGMKNPTDCAVCHTEKK